MKTTVLDTSAWINILLGLASGQVLRDHEVVVSAHFDVEVTSTLRKLLLADRIGAADFEDAVEAHLDFPFTRVPFNGGDLRRCLSLKNRMSVGNAWYLAVAEHHDAPWITDDERAARTAEALGARIERQLRV